MELWYTEYQTKNTGITCKINKTLYSEKTKYQEINVIDTEEYGIMLVLDGTVQTNEKDEFVYHEMLAHVPMFTHKNPENVLVIGGGDGGVIREVVKHKSVKKAVLVEIDGSVVEVSKKYLKTISCSLEDENVEVRIQDGIEYVNDNKGIFDIILIDSTDPVGPAVGLFSREFFGAIYESLKPDGLFVAQTESPFLHKKLIKGVYNDVKAIFALSEVYTCPVPTYPGGFWSFVMGSKLYKPADRDKKEITNLQTKYFNADIFKAAFALPQFLKEELEG